MPEPEAPERDLWHDLQPLLDRELSRLPAKYRVPIVLCDLQGRPRKEVARQLGWPEGTLSGRLARARQALAKRLTQRGVTVSATALAMVLGRDAAAADVPAVVVSATIQAAILDAAGSAVTGAIPAPVTALTEGVLKDMLLTKLTMTTAVLLAVSLLALSGGFLAFPTATGQEPTPSNGEATPVKPGAATPKTDREKLQGVWKVIWTKVGGKREKVEKSYFLVDGNRACLQSSDSELQGGLYLDATTWPRGFDLAMSDRTLEGIYDLDGDLLLLSYDLADNAKRPRKMAVRPGSRQVLIALTRQKEFGSALNFRRPAGSKAFPTLVERVENGPPRSPPRNLDSAPPPAEGREIIGLREQVKSLERRVAALEAKVKLAPGARNKQPSRIGQIIIVGNNKSSDSVIRKKVGIYPGQVLDTQALRAAEKRLAEFNATVTVVENGGDSTLRDILVTVKEK